MAEFNIEILPDGSKLKITTDDLSGPHHKSADDFIKEIEKLMGGAVETKKKQKGLHHKHHDHIHHQH